MKKKYPFLYGLGQNKSQYKELGKYFDIKKIDWNNGSLAKLKLGKPEVLVGFSLGCMVACMQAQKHKVKHLVLCSMSPGMESLKGIKANRIDFIVGEKEKWVLNDLKRLIKSAKCDWRIYIVPKANHGISRAYLRELLLVLKED